MNVTVEALGILATTPSIFVSFKKGISEKTIANDTCVAMTLAIIAVKCYSLPAGILACIQIVRIAKILIYNPHARTNAIKAIIPTILIYISWSINPVLGWIVTASVTLTPIIIKTDVFQNIKHNIESFCFMAEIRGRRVFNDFLRSCVGRFSGK